MSFEHLCVKPSARQNKLPIGSTHLCKGCGSEWVVDRIDGRPHWVRRTHAEHTK